jgi:hypothetical protein
LQHVAFCSSFVLTFIRVLFVFLPAFPAGAGSSSFEHDLIRKPERHFSGSCSLTLSG